MAHNRPGRGRRAGLVVALLLGLVCVGVRSAVRVSGQTAAPIHPLEFPEFDGAVRNLLVTGEAARHPPSDDESRARRIGDLMSHAAFREALSLARGMVDERPAALAAAVRYLASSVPVLHSTGGRWDAAVREIRDAARARAAGLPAEDAAVVLRQLINLDGAIAGNSSNYEPALRALIERFPGTRAAVEAEVELLDRGRVDRERLDALARYAREHDGTDAAALALDRLANHLAHNPLREERRADPTPRFLRLRDVVRQLEAPAYADGPWRDRGRNHLFSFYYSDNVVFDSDASVRQLIDEYREVITDNFALSPRGIANNDVGFLVTNRLFGLYGRLGDPIDGVERLLTELEGEVDDAPAVRYLRAHFYIHLFRYPDAQADTRAVAVSRARATLRALADQRRQPYARRALASLASIHVFEREYAEAAAVHREFIDAYPREAYTWVARLRLGQSLMELGDLEGARLAYRRAAETDDAPPVASVLGAAFEADLLAALGDGGAAAERAAWALSRWDDDYGEEYRADPQQRSLPNQEPFAIPRQMTVTRLGLARRAAQLRASAATRGGDDLERGRWLLDRGRADEAVPILARAAAVAPESSLAADARHLMHDARLTAALAQADVNNPGRDEDAALRLLESLGREPADTAVLTARIAHATLLALRGDRDRGSAEMQAAFDAWLARQMPAPAPPAVGTLEADVAAIRAEVFKPRGGGVYAGRRWNAFTFPTAPPPYLLANPTVLVKLADGTTSEVTLRQPIAPFETLVYTTSEDLERLTEIIRTLGGTATRQPQQVMETPNQPVGRSQDIRAFWNEFFPMRAGHWGGWELETYPTITDVEFFDDARTRAAVRVTVGFSGGTVLLEKTADGWRATELTGLWVT